MIAQFGFTVLRLGNRRRLNGLQRPRRYIMRLAAFVFLFSVGLFLGGMTGSSSAAVSANAQRACMGDYFRFCSYTGGNVPRASACMRRHYAQLSQQCRIATATRPARTKRAVHRKRPTHTYTHKRTHTHKHKYYKQ
jgi:hypothetical protein